MGCEWNFSFMTDVLFLFTKGNSGTMNLYTVPQKLKSESKVIVFIVSVLRQEK